MDKPVKKDLGLLGRLQWMFFSQWTTQMSSRKTPLKFFLRFMLFKFEGEEALKKGGSRKLWNPIINAGEKVYEKRERDDRSTWYTSRRNLLKEHLENDND